MDEERPWEPEPIAAEEFHAAEVININRAPPEIVGDVLYKRNAHIKRVRYRPMEAAPSATEPWRGQGEAIVRWLLSEAPGSAEGRLRERRFHRLLDVTLKAGAATGERAHTVDRILYVIAGEGRLYYRAHNGAPHIARPLRPGDLVHLPAGIWHSFAQEGPTAPLRLILLELEPTCP